MARTESKARSRQRLLDAALEILDEGDVPDVTTVEVTKRAGLAQSSFYVHFSSVDHLLKDLVDEVWDQRREASRLARESVGLEPRDEYYRVRFTAHIQGLIAHPSVFRLVLRSRLDQASIVGQDARAQQAKSRQNLTEWLRTLGAPDDTDADRRRLAMMAAGLVAVNETIALGHLDGDFPEFDEVLEVVQLFHETIGRVVTTSPGDAADQPR
ncbi:MAG: TetR/AcrR family transcriptional regulator [Acidimicrobiales bacterium]